MKKTISINIAGIVFYIEEDGYDKLSAYLKAIQKHFATYEGSNEIIADIEGRIAEKFWNKQKNDGTQAITLEDVEELIVSMGTVSDFEAIQEDEDLSNDKTYAANDETPPQTEKPKRLFRDIKHKILAGVCAGFAHYLGIDALWIRLTFLILLFGLSPLTDSPLSGAIIIIYLASWVAFPANAQVEDDDTIKKFYRNPDHKVLGGVVSGIASYTGYDLGMLRFFFVLSIPFFGSGLIIYLMLWIISPEAKTLTDKMQMSGEPITLENIELNIKKTINAINKPENGITKLLLLPFRVLSQILGALMPLFSSMVRLIGVFTGLLMLGTALMGIVVLVFALFVAVVGLESTPMYIDDIPLGLLSNDVSSLMVTFVFISSIIPLIVIGLAGITLISKKKFFTPVVWQTLFGLFFIGLFGSMFFGVRYAKNFVTRATIEQTEVISFNKKTPLFDLNKEDGLHLPVHIELIGYEGNDIKVEKIFSSQGLDKKDAENNITNISYKMVKKDSVLLFSDNLLFTEKSRFRGQQLEIKLYIPYNQEFSMTESMAYFITNSIKNTYFEQHLFKGSLWQFTPDGELTCINRFPIDDDNNAYSDDHENDFSSNQYVQKYPLKDFERIETDLKGVTTLIISRGDTYRLEVGGSQEGVATIKSKVENNKLYIMSNTPSDTVQVEIHITLPKLSSLHLLSGVGNTKIKDLDTDQLTLDIRSNNQVKIAGRTNNLQAKLAQVASLEAYDLMVDFAEIKAADKSRAEVQAGQSIEALAEGYGRISYRGTDNVQKTVKENGIIRRDDE